MKTFDDFKKESVDGYIENLKSLPDEEYPIQISVDAVIRRKPDIWKKANLYAINRIASVEARKIYKEASKSHLRELVLPKGMEYRGLTLEPGAVIPYWGNGLIECPGEITSEQFIFGIALSIETIAPVIDDPKFLPDMFDLLSTFGEYAIDFLSRDKRTKVIADKLIEYMESKNDVQ